MALPLDERFWSRVERRGADECWLWTGGCDTRGYGRIKVEGRQVIAHRLAYELAIGPIPDGRELDHRCRSLACCNPSHLEPVTHRENVLRGVSPTAANAQKTHCIRGHALTGDNLRTRRDGTRQCRRCHREQEQRRRAAARKHHSRRRT